MNFMKRMCNLTRERFWMLNFKLDLAQSYKNLKTGGDKKDKNWRRV